ncbi:hypothetical protein [Prosthecobacter sp.]|uniref:hypothetical protein n=1 Tax=Prosthecobacter sp. TaxID=1965333 RepID=UPI003782FD0F
MRASAAILLVVLAALAMLGTPFVILRLPYVPNWPYVGAVCLAVSVLAGVIYLIVAWRHLNKPSPVTAAWLLRVFPLWLSAFALFWSWIRLSNEEMESLDFSDGVVVEKYHSHNHHYPSVRVQIEGRGTFAIEGVPANTWDMIATGSRVSKRCGRHIVVKIP